jgi:sugar O-acyltransferase (sialic acid O-acetyltransferase NeuD family)
MEIFRYKMMEGKRRKMKKDLIIVGAGGYGREVLQIVKDINKVEDKWNILGFINDIGDALDNYECDYSIIGTIKDWIPQEGQEFVCAVADPLGKELVTKTLKEKGAVFTSAIHPTAYISEYAKVGEGVVMSIHSGISVNCKIGDFVTVLYSTIIGHDVNIGNYCTISSLSECAGGVELEEKVFLGSHVTVIPRKKVCTGAYVAAGSVVVTNIQPGNHVMGNPAKKID